MNTSLPPFRALRARFGVSGAFILAALLLYPASLAAQGIKVDSVLTTRKNLGPAVNTPGIEIMPLISPDGSTLYFDRKYDKRNVGGEEDADDIYYSTLQPDGTWSEARNIGAPLNTKGSDVLFWISPDGNTALVHTGGKKAGLGISTRTKGKWGKPRPISIKGVKHIHELGDGYSATISADGQRLILAISRDKNNTENLDLFSAPALGSDYLSWGEPVPFGDNVNTARYELAPFIAPDNKTLYFSTAGHLGYGSADIFMTRRLDDSWQKWSDPENLGASVNTPDYDISISIAPDSRHAYLSAVGLMGEESQGRSDIYRVTLEEKVRPTPIVRVRGTLRAGLLGVKGLVRAERASDGSEVASTLSAMGGDFELRLQGGEEYRLTGWSQGYEEGRMTIDLRTASYSIAPIAIVLEPERPSNTPARPTTESKPKGSDEIKHLKLLDITDFAIGSSELPAGALPQLQQLLIDLRTLYAGQVLTIELAGYTDDTGKERDNDGLSVERAERIKEWLVENGIEPTMIFTMGRGEAEPLAPNGTDAERAKNRRVEVRILRVDLGSSQ